MTADRSLERRVKRLENDTSSIYEVLTGIRRILRDHDKRFDRIDQRLNGHDQRFDRMDLTLAEILRRLPEPA